MRKLIAATLAIGIITSTAALLLVGRTGAQPSDPHGQPTLKLGDPAPALRVGKWVKGEPVAGFEKGKVYLMEFWATWCPPCIEAMPHVTALQKKYQDQGFVAIAMNVWEPDQAVSEAFVKKMGDKMDLRVAADAVAEGQEPEAGAMSRTWMIALGQSTLPTSVLIDREGRIAWIGDPNNVERPLARMLAGTHSIQKEIELVARREMTQKRFAAAIEAKDYDEALRALDAQIAADPDYAGAYRPTRVRVYLQKKDYKRANAAAREAAEGDQPQTRLYIIAQMLLGAAEESKQVDVDLAMKIAEQGVAKGGEGAYAGRAVIAQAYAAKGDYRKAIEHVKAAIAGATRDDDRDVFQRDLATYEKKLRGR